MSKYLITGGAGFIGSHFLIYMVNKYPEDVFINLDKLTYAANLDNLASISTRSNYRFIKGDITDRELIFDLFKKESFDIVINFAAESHVDRSILDATDFITTNVVGTQVLLDACREYGITRFHQVSTDEVYGDTPIDSRELFNEDSLIKPSSPYSASKASADLLVMAYQRTYKLPVSISRCSNNYGYFQHQEKLIPLMINRALHNEPLPIYGNGKNIRDWIHVFDHCKAIDFIIHHLTIGEIYNIGSHNEVSNLDLVKCILDILDKPYDLITYVKDRPGHDLRYAIDSSKLQCLGWKPEIGFKEGLRDTIEYYKKSIK